MEQQEIIDKLTAHGILKLTTETRYGTYMMTNRSSLLAEQVSNRSSADWKKAQYIIVRYDSISTESLDDCLQGWESMAQEGQFLLINESNEWNCFDASGNPVILDTILGDVNPVSDLDSELNIETPQIIYYGAPGTGKTYHAKQVACYKIAKKEKIEDLSPDERQHIGFVQFHPSYDYTDFVEGLRPDENGNFERQDGVFKAFCKKALDFPAEPFVFIIDEINRGELSKIFGELFYSIEPDYRGPEGRVRTQYNNMVEKDDPFYEGFYVPENVYIIGTMNDVDRGVEAMDFAIRRRFTWKEITAEDSINSMGITGKAEKKMTALNAALKEKGLSRAYYIGGAYFRHLKGEDFNGLWENHLKGIITEYFRGYPDIDGIVSSIHDAYCNAGEEPIQIINAQADEDEPQDNE